MKVRHLIMLLVLAATATLTISAQEHQLPQPDTRLPQLSCDWFPSRMHAFIWRNWQLIPAKRLAAVLGTDAKQVTYVARSMGLPPQRGLQREWQTSRGYITVLKRNWHLLPYDQLLQLLGMSREELAWRLVEDDFLSVKVGGKPEVEVLRYEAPTPEMERRAAAIARCLQELGDDVWTGEERRFKFIDEFKKPRRGNKSMAKGTDGGSQFDLRILSSYFTDYGDPLMDPQLSSYPEGLLQRLSEQGVNGLWLHSVLRMLVPPSGIMPGDKDYQKRIDGLRRLVKRAEKYGIGIYLYMNEPRSMNTAYFSADEQHQALGGVREGDIQAFCTSQPEVLEWVSQSLERVFSEVPGLAGVFSITASENLTSCVSHNHHDQCPLCSQKSYADLIASVNQAICQGVKRGNPDAQVLVWDWGWQRDTDNIIPQLPKDCRLMSVSEWSLPIERGGVKSAVGEYSISSVGPGPRALSHWEMAKQAGLKTVAKVQVNCTWELATVPSIPVMDLVAEHAERLSQASTDGVLLSWSLGGYPSENMEVFKSVGPGNKEAVLDSLACANYGNEAAPFVRQAWRAFSDGFRQYPYHIGTLYNGPQQLGPANPFYLQPTGYRATMVGFPYDDLRRWRSVYPAEVWTKQMRRVAEGFEQGCQLLRQAEEVATPRYKAHIRTELLRATAIALHFASCANQAEFVCLRDQLLESEGQNATETTSHEQAADVKKLADTRQRLHAIVEAEREVTRRLLPIVKQDATIGYESSNQYFYLPVDLVEKYINLTHLLDNL